MSGVLSLRTAVKDREREQQHLIRIWSVRSTYWLSLKTGSSAL